MRPLAPKQQDLFALITRRAEEVIDRSSLREKLASRSNLRIKLGIDPTTPDLHLGHLVPLRMLRAFESAGHTAVLIVGDFTAEIGDPSGKAGMRRKLSPNEVRANLRTYRRQIGRVLDLKRVELRHNREWYSRMRLREFLDLLTHFSLKSAWERQDFQKRLRAGREVRLHEAMYHVLQAYDSVMVRADVELGSLDQRLNLLAGRELQKRIGFRYPPQDVILVPYLIGLDGVKKMSKTAGNTINLRDSAAEMFGKVMSIPDRLIVNYAELAAWMPQQTVAELERRLRGGLNPRDAKLEVAEAVVALYHGTAMARSAREGFMKIFSRRELGANLPRVALAHRTYTPLELLLGLKVCRSRSEARRLLAGRALEVNGAVVDPRSRSIKIEGGTTIRVGKRRFLRVV